MRFKKGDIVKRPNDDTRYFKVTDAFYSERYECNHVLVEGVIDSWYEGRFELVHRPNSDLFNLDALEDD